MKKIWLKIIVCVVLVMAGIITLIVFWPAQTPTKESKVTEHVQQEDKRSSKNQTSLRQLKVTDLLVPPRFRRDARERILSRSAPFRRGSGKLPVQNYNRAVDSYSEIVTQSPINTDLASSGRFSRDVPERYGKQLNVAGEKSSLEYPDSLRNKRSIELARRMRPKTAGSEKPNQPKAELPQSVSFYNKSGESSAMSYETAGHPPAPIIKRPPHGSEPGESRNLLRRLSRWYHRRQAMKGRGRRSRSPSRLKAKKSKRLRRRLPRGYFKRYEIPDEERSTSDQTAR